ncbi:type IV toxin-antitoxin system AbiEi family antitoxin domain-containing protein [Agrococcus jejuensis]|nr:type IV toxin-antitoxin system AbiEi family antitoxin domain-containing protein [Agrococcus jejuensis]
MIDPLIRQHGVLTVAQLERLGLDRASREAAVRAGALLRVRPGWYARADASPTVVAAVKAGGCVSCASALRLRGAWVPAALDRTHVRRARRSDGIRPPRDCRPHGPLPPVTSAIDDLETAFRCLLRCGSIEDVVVVADSLLHRRLATRDELNSWMRGAPSRIRALLDEVDVAESGTESMTRFRLRRRNVRVRTQVWIGRRRVDMVVGDLLVIECDSDEHHGSWQAHSADRERDRILVADGYVVVRLTYRQIVDDWPTVERDLLAIIRRGAHRRPRRTKCS